MTNMNKQRYYTNGVLYEGGQMKDARDTLGPILYKKYGNFGPSLTDRHVVSYPLVESFTIGNWVYEVYEYECMNFNFRGYVSENHSERAIRFYPLLKD